VCVGETATERDAGNTDEVVLRQVASAIDGLRVSEASRLVIAYEPVWAIGTGRACAPVEAARVAELVRAEVERAFGAEVSQAVRILYGGSVNPANVVSFLAVPTIDGALVGGASLVAESFGTMVAAAAALSPGTPS
jgi:triosephosphate isomerase